MNTDWRTGEPRAANEAVKEIRKKSKAYALMTDAEKQLFHTEVYAFRAVYLNLEGETSPCDPKGEWFNRVAVGNLVREKHSKRERIKREKAAAKDGELQREGRDIVNKWAQERGFSDIDDYCERTNRPWVDVYTEIVEEICATTRHESGILFPARIGHFRSLADCIGGGGKRQPPEQNEPWQPGP